MKETFPFNASMSGTFLIGGELPVHRLGFGAMRITGPGIWGEPKNPNDARAVLHRAIELGVNLIDTADSYGPEVSENLIAEALYPYPSDLVIATKGGLTRQGPNQWAPIGRPEYLTQCVEMSLRRLRLNRIDLYQFHRIDPLVPLEESLGALKEMQTQGKIRCIGLSNFSLPEIERAKKIVNFVSIQNRYNISDRQSEDVVHYCEKHQLAFFPWYPMASGDLAKPGGKLDELAKRKGVTTAQVAISWLLKHSKNILPIPGTSSVAHLEANIGAAALDLTNAELSQLEII